MVLKVSAVLSLGNLDSTFDVPCLPLLRCVRRKLTVYLQLVPRQVLGKVHLPFNDHYLRS
jgi:hypothetical protein